jgi:serine/threonine-protein kinase HipA
LLAYYGRESAGALTLQTQEEPEAQSGYVLLSDEELHERIAKLPKKSLSVGAPKHMSNAGGQHKLAVCLREGQLYHPVGNTPSTWLLKPDHEEKDSWPSSVANEYFTMQLAAHLGLRVPEVAIRFVPDAVYLIQRFDRIHNAEPVRACMPLMPASCSASTASSVSASRRRCAHCLHRSMREPGSQPYQPLAVGALQPAHRERRCAPEESVLPCETVRD